MKHQNGKQSRTVMRFFTPELYIRFNSTDDKTADLANEEWESALESYQMHLDKLRDLLPSQVRDLPQVSLHDAELLACDQKVQPSLPLPFDASLWTALGMLSFRLDDMVSTFVYGLWDSMREYPAPDDWPFSKQRTHWLYDEVDVAPSQENRFLHRILLSDGRVLEIPFVNVVTQRFPLNTQESADSLKQVAG